MMRRLSQTQVLTAAVVIAAVLIQSSGAFAWGPRARQAIALASVNLARQSFKTSDVSYEADILRGAGDGVSALGGNFPLSSDEQAIDAVGLEIIILREAIKNGGGSHAAYRLGGLAALVSELMVPFGMVYDENERELAAEIEKDLEDHVATFAYSPTHPNYHYLTNHRLYFQDRRTFYYPDKEIIADDYHRGIGPRGLLKSAVRAYFDKSIEAVTDVWYTTLVIEPGTREYRPSNRQMAYYYISEIKYLLSVKQNPKFAERSYELFERYNPGLPMALVEIGDAFYALGVEVEKTGSEEAFARGQLIKTRGVEEWQKAQRIPGDARVAASQRLAKHFIEEGERLYARGLSPEGKDTDLPDALEAFKTALEYDLQNDIAASRVTETTEQITARRNRHELEQRFLDQASAAVKSAERSAVSKDFGAALSSYSQAINALGQVTVDFKDLNDRAREEMNKINTAVKQVISDVYASANEAIEKGDAALINSNVDEAVRFYASVESIVNVVPAEEGTQNANKKQDMINAAQNKIDEAEIQRKRMQQQQQQPAAGAPPPKRT